MGCPSATAALGSHRGGVQHSCTLKVLHGRLLTISSRSRELPPPRSTHGFLTAQQVFSAAFCHYSFPYTELTFSPLGNLGGPVPLTPETGYVVSKHVQWVPLPRGCSWLPLLGLLRGESERRPNCRPDRWASKPSHTRGSSVQYGRGAMKN